MKIDNVSFPYPVLGINDDIIPLLDEKPVDITIDESNRDTFVFNVQLMLNNEDILNYISSGDAVFSVELSCQQTLFRQCVESAVPAFSFSIERKRLNGSLHFECFVVATRDICNYQNKGMNEDYHGHVINLRRGDLLVAFPHADYPLNLDLRNIRNPKSFISVVLNKDESEKYIKYDVDSQKIQILLPQRHYNYFKEKELDKQAPNEMKASLYLNALTYALYHFKSSRHKELIWTQTLSFRFKEPDICGQFNIEDLFESEDSSMNQEDFSSELFRLAQALLRDPYDLLFKTVSKQDGQLELNFD